MGVTPAAVWLVPEVDADRRSLPHRFQNFTSPTRNPEPYDTCSIANASGSVAAAITRRSLRRGTVHTLVGPTDAQIQLVLNGKQGTAMASWKQLSDTDIAAVITYTRNSWGNKSGDVLPPAVKTARQ